MKTILGAYGVVDLAPLQVSDILRRLNMSHTFAFRQGVRYNTLSIDGLTKEQPVWPVITDSVRTMERMQLEEGRYVYFVVDSRAALSHTNITRVMWPEEREDRTITEAIKAVLVHSHKRNLHWEYLKKEPSLMDYVNYATKPSFLNNIQTQFYKINPYALRKEVQILCISYLAGYTSYTEMKRKLKSNLKFQALFELVDSTKAKELRAAVEMTKNKSVEQVAKETGFATFELLYIKNSGAQNRPA